MPSVEISRNHWEGGSSMKSPGLWWTHGWSNEFRYWVYVQTVRVGLSRISRGSRRMEPWGVGKMKSGRRKDILDKSWIPNRTPPLSKFSFFSCNTESIFLLVHSLILLCRHASRQITVWIKYAEPGPQFRPTQRTHWFSIRKNPCPAEGG